MRADGALTGDFPERERWGSRYTTEEGVSETSQTQKGSRHPT